MVLQTKRLVLLFGVVLGVFVLAAPASAAVSTIVPSEDAYVRQDQPSCPFGGTGACSDRLNLRADLEAGAAGSASQARTYLKFAAVPANAMDVRLRLYVSDATNLSPYVRLSSSNWSESTVTWNTRPGLSGTRINAVDPLGPAGAYYEWNVTSLTPAVGGTVSFTVVPRSTDGAVFDSRENAHPPQLVVTAAGTSDTTAPSVPTSLVQTASTSTSVTMGWTASTDNVGVTGYDTFRGGVLQGSNVSGTSYTYTGLTCGTTYTGTVRARDAAGNVSAQSAGQSLTTTACPTTQPVLTTSPSSLSFSATAGGANPVTQNIAVSNTGSGTLSWTVADDQPWLTEAPTSGTNAGTIAVTAATGTLAPGTYTGNVTVAATGAAGSPKTIAVTFTVSAAGGSPSFVDDFNGAAGAEPDSTKWTDYGPGCGAYVGWDRITCGPDTLDGSGHLALTATPSAGRGIQTKGKFGFLYGTASAWIKMATTAGYWPAFWSLNGSQAGSELLTGESDVTEVYTQFNGSNSRIHVWNGGTESWKSPNILCCTGTDLKSSFHKYSAKYEPGKITYYVDDVQIGQVTKAGSPSPWAFGPDLTRDNFLILDLAVGGGGQAAPSVNGTMLVDRVEVTPLA
jgi:beta-glucanase (GH16 family)